ncbi:YagA, partial [Escherichia coli O26:H11 str. CVM9952]
MPMILVKKNPRGKVIRELSSEEETAVKTVCGLKKPATWHYITWPMIFSGKCVSMM